MAKDSEMVCEELRRCAGCGHSHGSVMQQLRCLRVNLANARADLANELSVRERVRRLIGSAT